MPGLSAQAADTIAAIATARGQAALAIVRLSGPQAVAVAARVFQGADLRRQPSHTVRVGHVLEAEGMPIDQVVATVFRAPRSATGEDVVELTCHGGDFAAPLILERLVEAGARHAAPGEFTQRAFLNGKLDLAQAEAVADLIHASSTLAHRVSVGQLQGRYSQQLERLRQDLLELCAYAELELDFSEEDVAFADRARMEALLEQAGALLQTLLGSYRLGDMVREGVCVVIGGRPNAGKSTLLNALLGRQRAIVSATPGTTRDAIEAEAEIDGVRFRFVDTAGLRDTQDAIEAEGVARARQAMAHADLLLYVFDVQQGLAAQEEVFLAELQSSRPDLAVVIVGNKADLVAQPAVPGGGLALSAVQAFAQPALLAPLVERLQAATTAGLTAYDASHLVTNQRHRSHLSQAAAALARAQAALRQGLPADLVVVDLRLGLQELGAITGAVTNEDVLDQIFSRFCIGK